MQSLSYKRLIILFALAALFVLVITNFKIFLSTIGSFFSILAPFFVGFAIAFVLNLLIKVIEGKFFVKMKGKLWLKFKRPLAMIMSYAFTGMVIYFVISIIVPQLVISINSLVDTIAVFIKGFDVHFVSIMDYLNLNPQLLGDIQIIIKDWILNIIELLKDGLPQVLGVTMGITSGIVNLVLGLVFSIYMLANKEDLCAQCKRVLFAFVSKEKANRILYVVDMSNHMFGKFVSGQLTEAVIISCLCFTGMVVLHLPYALLVSVIIGATAIIPIFGAFIGTIPCAFIILMVDPMQAVIFVIFILVMQQFEGNIIYPRVVGSSIGLPGLWVLLALLIGGGIAGIKGIIIGIPLFAVVAKLFQEYVSQQIAAKDLEAELELSKSVE